jgi:hypothetical protein
MPLANRTTLAHGDDCTQVLPLLDAVKVRTGKEGGVSGDGYDPHLDPQANSGIDSWNEKPTPAISVMTNGPLWLPT